MSFSSRSLGDCLAQPVGEVAELRRMVSEGLHPLLQMHHADIYGVYCLDAVDRHSDELGRRR